MVDRPLWAAARITFVGALALFITTIVIGILNGLDLYSPDHDTLIGHVHSGTLGWITLALTGAAFLVFGEGVRPSAGDLGRAKRLAWAVTGAITLYVAAFYAGDAISDRIQRPVAGAVLLVVVIWLFVWLLNAYRGSARTVARLGLVLAYLSMLVGAVFGIILGLATAGKDVPGLSQETTDAVAEAHPPAMVVGFLILASLAMIEYLLGDRETVGNRPGVVQMWLLFGAGMVVNIAFVADLVDQLLGPANLAMIAGVVMLLVRRRADLMPAVWKGSGTGAFPRLGTVFLLGYLVLLTVIVVRFVSGSLDVDTMSPSDEGLVIGLDHTMFIGVMTNALFGTLAVAYHGKVLALADRVLLWGVNIGVVGFVVGLLTVEAVPKRIFTPLMGLSLLFGIAYYLRRLVFERAAA